MRSERDDGTLTPEVIRWAQAVHGHSVNKAAKHLKVDRRTMQYWRSGQRIPRWIVHRDNLRSYIYGAQRIERDRCRNSSANTQPPSRSTGA